VDNLEEARKKWLRDQPFYALFIESLRKTLREKFRDPGIQIYGRPKEIDSLLKKLIRKQDKTYENMTDKAGLRVVVKYPDEIDTIGKFIEERFPCHKKDDKRLELKIDQVGYSGIHYDIQLEDAEAEATGFKGMWAEIQVRTLGQNLWSDMSHGLGYKSDFSIPDLISRRLNRLSALVELADDEFLRLRDTMQEVPGFNIYKVLGLLEKQFYKFAAVEYDKDLSLDAINLLDFLYGTNGLIGEKETFEQFCEDNAQKILLIFDSNRETIARPLFLFQPESLMIFHLLERDKFKLRHEWEKSFPADELEQLAVKWGNPLS
jgi:ppGpp synthetase/RelA/SpoT-type nucleotidyltranferase